MQELENFNVRVLYDKLEDQNLHLAAQLARQKDDLDHFYKSICNQNDELCKLLNNLDPAKLENQQLGIVREGLLGTSSGEGGPTIVNASITAGDGANRLKYAGGSQLTLGVDVAQVFINAMYIALIFCDHN